jgi:hypothetical protein
MVAASFLLILGLKPFEGFQPKINKKIQWTAGVFAIEKIIHSAPKKKYNRSLRYPRALA